MLMRSNLQPCTVQRSTSKQFAVPLHLPAPPEHHTTPPPHHLPAVQVIYHLHTRSEDHDFELQELREQYEAEVEVALREGEARLQQQAAQAQQQHEQACDELRAQVGDACRQRRRGWHTPVHGC